MLSFFKPLEKIVSSYLDKKEIQEIKRAYNIAFSAHEGQIRISGEPYITHPVAVAEILAEMRLDQETIIASLLHDTIEDTEVTQEEIENSFGKNIADLVNGVSKLDKIAFKTRAEAQAANFRKVILAMASDMRVILIKLADRTHNMRTLDSLSKERGKRISMETLEIYAPIAHRLGIHNIKNELEDLGFKFYYPWRYRVLHKAVVLARLNKKEINQKILDEIKDLVFLFDPKARVVGRTKNIYSIYNKMRKKEYRFQDILDIYAFRIITFDIDYCYTILGRVHSLYKPRPGRFKDYIAIPKINGYQSIHTSLIGPHGVPVEIQIRTADMDKMADDGIAAHWVYKEKDNFSISQAQAKKWMNALLELQQKTSSATDFVENVKSDLFPEEIYVFTPNGKILDLPVGATPVDFAYHIHTDIGNNCIGAKVDKYPYPLSKALSSGQTIEIIVTENSSPNAAWINFVVTSKARIGIRNFLKSVETKDALISGERLLNSALLPRNIDSLSEKEKEILYKPNYNNFNELLIGIGLGDVFSVFIVQKLLSGSSIKDTSSKLPLVGSNNLLTNFAKCCCPVYGDAILGRLNKDKGLIVHRDSCLNIKPSCDSEKYIRIYWQKHQDMFEYKSKIKVDLHNRSGALASVTGVISSNHSNISHLYTEEKSGRIFLLECTISVKNLDHLNSIINQIKSLTHVIKVCRIFC